MHYTATYPSPLGVITLASDGDRLTGLWFNGQKHFGLTLDADHEPRHSLHVFDLTRRWLDSYFSGQMPDFTPPINLLTTPFGTAVCNMLCSIPFGETTTYGAIARRIARDRGLAHFSAQAVAGAVARNPISIIIPCHRVVGSDGSLTGYAGGLDRKMKLLEIERNALKGLKGQL
ncbi:MAG: methylated-DNA--[Muribaculaceae bacterium]|nr:methylated-DNA--[protein]-cysteine S-methyltransferase [Muribaculaceae bacterium]